MNHAKEANKFSLIVKNQQGRNEITWLLPYAKLDKELVERHDRKAQE